MSLFEIPVSNVPQTFQIALGGREYLLTCKWNDAPDAGWVLDFADAESGEPIVAGLPVITGRNILNGLDYLNFGGKLFAYTEGDQYAVPTLENLGIESKLYFETVDDV